MSRHSPVVSVLPIASAFPEYRRRWFLLPLLIISLFISLLTALPARAQVGSVPGVGLSASKTAYVDSLSVLFDVDFPLYAVITGPADGSPLTQSISTVPWVIHQPCCGAVLEIRSIAYNPAMTHTGHPLVGTVSVADSCLTQGEIWLATLTVRLVSANAGEVLWASGPFGAISDCSATALPFRGLAVNISLRGNPTPTEPVSWGLVKAQYR